LLALWLVLFAGSTILYEYGRSAWARHRMKSENIFLALWRLAGRNRRRFGGHIIHLGVVLIALGIIGIEMFQSETQGSLPQGGQLTLGQYTIRYDQLDEKLTTGGILRTVAEVSLYKNGRFIDTLYPRRDYYFDSQQPMTIPGLRSTLEDDLYVVLVDWEPISEEGATFKVYHNPLVNWVWIGGMVLILGTLVGAWPEREKEEIANGE
jgi:cytochrome c-type biogenesis protein CcmF